MDKPRANTAVAHKLEQASGFKVPHGEAVAIGMAAAGRIERKIDDDAVRCGIIQYVVAIAATHGVGIGAATIPVARDRGVVETIGVLFDADKMAADFEAGDFDGADETLLAEGWWTGAEGDRRLIDAYIEADSY